MATLDPNTTRYGSTKFHEKYETLVDGRVEYVR